MVKRSAECSCIIRDLVVKKLLNVNDFWALLVSVGIAGCSPENVDLTWSKATSCNHVDLGVN